MTLYVVLICTLHNLKYSSETSIYLFSPWTKTGPCRTSRSTFFIVNQYRNFQKLTILLLLFPLVSTLLFLSSSLGPLRPVRLSTRLLYHSTNRVGSVSHGLAVRRVTEPLYLLTSSPRFTKRREEVKENLEEQNSKNYLQKLSLSPFLFAEGGSWIYLPRSFIYGGVIRIIRPLCSSCTVLSFKSLMSFEPVLQWLLGWSLFSGTSCETPKKEGP